MKSLNIKKIIQAVICLAITITGIFFLKNIFYEYYEIFVQAIAIIVISFGLMGLYSIIAKTSVTSMFAISSGVGLVAYGAIIYRFYTGMSERPTTVPYYLILSLFVHLAIIALSCLIFFLYKKIRDMFFTKQPQV